MLLQYDRKYYKSKHPVYFFPFGSRLIFMKQKQLKDTEEKLDFTTCIRGVQSGIRGNSAACSSHGQSSGAHAITYAVGPEFSAVAATAVDVSVRTIVQVGGVQRATAFSTVEAASMPDLKDGTGHKILGTLHPLLIFICIFIYIHQITTGVKHNPTGR